MTFVQECQRRFLEELASEMGLGDEQDVDVQRDLGQRRAEDGKYKRCKGEWKK